MQCTDDRKLHQDSLSLRTLHILLPSCPMNSLQSVVVGLEAVDEESSIKLVHSSFRESGFLATLRTGEGRVGGCPEG